VYVFDHLEGKDPALRVVGKHLAQEALQVGTLGVGDIEGVGPGLGRRFGPRPLGGLAGMEGLVDRPVKDEPRPLKG